MEEIFPHTVATCEVAFRDQDLRQKMKHLLFQLVSEVVYTDESYYLKLASSLKSNAGWSRYNKLAYDLNPASSCVNSELGYVSGIYQITCATTLSNLSGFDVDFLFEKRMSNRIKGKCSIIHPSDLTSLSKKQRVAEPMVPDLDIHGIFDAGQSLLPICYLLTKDWSQDVSNKPCTELNLSLGFGGQQRYKNHGILRHVSNLCAFVNGFTLEMNYRSHEVVPLNVLVWHQAGLLYPKLVTRWHGLVKGSDPMLKTFTAYDFSGKVLNGRYQIQRSMLNHASYLKVCSAGYYLSKTVFPNTYQDMFIPWEWSTKCNSLNVDDKNALKSLGTWYYQSSSLMAYRDCGGTNCGVK